MIRRQPSSTLTDTSFPSPRLFRSEQGSMFDPGPCMYMEKIATGPQARDAIDLNRSPTENLKAVAAAKGESVRDPTAVILDRPRHEQPIVEVCAGGARVRPIPDGDVAGAIPTRWPQYADDHLTRSVGTPEAVIPAPATSAIGKSP